MMWWLPKVVAVVLAVGQPMDASDLPVGAEALCPNQVEGIDDEELNCRVAAIVRGPGGVELVLLKETL